MNLDRKTVNAVAIRESVAELFGYDMDRNVNARRQNHVYTETCQCCVPEAIICALEATSFWDAIRNAISLGGDTDTLAAIGGSIAETLYGLGSQLRRI